MWFETFPHRRHAPGTISGVRLRVSPALALLVLAGCAKGADSDLAADPPDAAPADAVVADVSQEMDASAELDVEVESDAEPEDAATFTCGTTRCTYRNYCLSTVTSCDDAGCDTTAACEPIPAGCAACTCLASDATAGCACQSSMGVIRVTCTNP